MFKQICLALTIGVLAAQAGSDAAPAPSVAVTAVPMKKDSGVYVVPVSANGSASFDCIVDSGASDVNVPDTVFRKLLKSGAIRQSDYMGTTEYTLADGSTQRGRTYRFKTLKVGNIVVNDVVASVGGDGDSGLLGQSFLERFASWSVDNSHHTLMLNGAPRAAPASSHPATHPPIARPADLPPDTTSVAQTSGGHADDTDDAPRDPTDDHLTAQHSQ